MGLPDSVSVGELAQLVGMSERRVQQYADRGVMVKAGHGQYALAESVGGYCAHLREQAEGRNVSMEERSEKARLIAAQANMMELKLARESGSFLVLDEVEQVIEQGIAAARQQFMYGARKLKKRIDDEYGINTDLRLLTEHHAAVLQRLADCADQIDSGDFGVDGAVDSEDVDRDG